MSEPRPSDDDRIVRTPEEWRERLAPELDKHRESLRKKQDKL